MKKLILTVTASLACVAAFAQGKVSFQTDSLHLAYFSAVAPGDEALLGQGVSSTSPQSGALVADLYVGTSSTALTLVSSTSFSAVPGKWTSASVTVPGIAGGTSVFMAAQVRDQSATPASAFTGTRTAGSTYWGASQIFTFTLGSSITYPFMYTSPTWAAGTFALDQYGAGSKGAIAVSAVPEPASFALAGLGIAALTILRRRK